jgi:penicillin-insensitive murein DD-endopeptidase
MKPLPWYLLPMPNCRMFLLVVVLLTATGLAFADSKNNPWEKVKTPSEGAPQAIGDYSAGCLQGARALPLDGEGYQVMHPSRRRYYGHPELIDFLTKLGKAVHEKGLGVILLGDLSQPRGGQASGGHASHETGLDVDVWYWHPKKSEKRALTSNERETIKAPSILDGKASSIKGPWSATVLQLLRLTAEDPRVERVFVHPIIKRELCEQTNENRAWLGKIRPWYGHDDHFHVRLTCPDESPDCIKQAKIPAGDGCDELDWWFSDESSQDREKGRDRYQSKVTGGRKMPAKCFELLK